MSKLSEMIARLCPNGVEYKKLGEVATIERGSGLKKKSDFVAEGFPCIHYGQRLLFGGRGEEHTGRRPDQTILLACHIVRSSMCRTFTVPHPHRANKVVGDHHGEERG